MKHFRLLTVLLLQSLCVPIGTIAASTLPDSYDVVIVGATPGGIMTAISAAREGRTVLILERTAHIGGLPVNGLGATDIATRSATTGLFAEFVGRNLAHYQRVYGKDSQQVKDCQNGFHFEPSVAEITFNGMLSEYKDKITILTLRQFDCNPENVKKTGGKIESVTVLNRENQSSETYSGKVFVDATYEGDLGAAAGVPFRVGREDRSEFGEVCAGKIYRHWGAGGGNNDSPGTTYIGDNAVQAYNYRLCLTADRANQTAIEKPEGYDRNEYVSIIDDLREGRNTGIRTPMRKGIAVITNMEKLPCGKTDANNQHLAFLSTDLPEENWPWPTASWEWRDKFARRLKNYTLGLLWFVQNDPELPASFKEECRKWGLASDEYTDNGNFPRQVYVREGRRFEGDYFFTANDALPVAEGQRPPVHANSITASHYSLDSHAVLKREEGRVHLEGFFNYPTAPYTVPIGVIMSEKVDNLLLPVPVSGSHVGFSTLRMEPCWMALGEAAGEIANEAILNICPVSRVNVSVIQERLVRNGATLIYYRDVRVDSADFAMVQRLGLKGYLPEWNARLDDEASPDDIKSWKKLSGFGIPKKLKNRREVLDYIDSRLQSTLKSSRIGSGRP